MDRRIEDYLAYLGAVRGLSPRTLRSYREDFECFERELAVRPGVEAGGFDIDSSTASDLRAFAAALVTAGKAGSSVNRALSALRGYFRYRVRFGGLAIDPSRDVEGLPSRRPLPRFLFEEEAGSFMSLPQGEGFAPTRDRAMLEFLYSTGCRVAEASNLTLDKLDLSGGSARVMGKGSKERVVFLADPAKTALGTYLPLRAERLLRLGAKAVAGSARAEGSGRPRSAGGDYLFVNARGGRLTERGIEWIIQGYAERSGSLHSVTPHAFRHSFATHLVGRGADIRAVQELLGHASVSTTQVYAHVDMERLRKVYEQAHPHGGTEVGPHGGTEVGLHGNASALPRGGRKQE
jgi:integrase/recombinase XerC